MQIENDYDKEVYNGDVGYVTEVEPDGGELTAIFDGRSVTYGFGELDTLVPAYAATIHKSQGSEYPAVVIPVVTQHYPMLQRNLLYTGVIPSPDQSAFMMYGNDVMDLTIFGFRSM
jgi:exodeoxyribonuclease V alpha subunit